MSDERMESPDHRCHRCERPVTGERRLCGPCAAGVAGRMCRCQHGIGLHDIGTRKADLGQRTTCSVSTGPKGTPCDCTTYQAEGDKT